jgi:hypothetical protein
MTSKKFDFNALARGRFLHCRVDNNKKIKAIHSHLGGKGTY